MPKNKRIPIDPEGMNENRAEWAQEAIDVFIVNTRADLGDAVCDLMADLGHWCDRNGMDLAAEIRRGAMHYQAEAPNGHQFDGLQAGVITR